jgi:glycosidase
MRIVAGVGLVAIVALVSCGPGRRERIPPMPELTSPREKIVIYQVMTRLFGNTVTTNKPFGTRDENGVGKFNDFTVTALHAIKELGVTHIWYTGVIEHATMTDFSSFGIPLDDPDVVKGRAGSPYSIKDYYDVNPDLAVDVRRRMSEFEQLIARTHSAGLKAVIDFVPNHVARKYASDASPIGVNDLGETDDKSKAFSASNNFYYIPGQSFRPPADYFRKFQFAYTGMDGQFEETPAKATGDDQFTAVPSMDNWFESMKLNYGIDYVNGRTSYFDPPPDTWVKMKDILVFWAQKGVDAFRCDMAQMVPVEFWRWAIPQVKAVNPDILFIAEIYVPSLYRGYLDRGRFDFLYDKVQLYDTLRLLIGGKASSTDVPGIRESLKDISPRMVHFLENHDEQRIASPFFAGDPEKALPGMVVSATIDEGPLMVFFGQEVGEPGAGAEGFNADDGRTTHFDYWGVPEHQKWMNGGKFDGGLLSDGQRRLRAAYGKIMNVARRASIANGQYADLTIANVKSLGMSNRVVAYARYTQDEQLVIVAGFNLKEEEVQIKLTPELLTAWSVNRTYLLEDLLGDSTVISMTAAGEASFRLPAFGARIYKLK